jgi:hypothetical protein
MTSKDAAMAGNVEISGLPFTVLNVNASYYPAVIVGRYANTTLTSGMTQLGGWAMVGTTRIRLEQSGSGVYPARLPVSALVFSSEIFLSVTYRIST